MSANILITRLTHTRKSLYLGQRQKRTEVAFMALEKRERPLAHDIVMREQIVNGSTHKSELPLPLYLT